MAVDLNISDILKMPIKIFVAIGIGTGLILFLPDEIIQKLYLASFRESFGFVIGLIFIISISIIGVALIISIYQMVRKKILIGKQKKFRENFIKDLDDYQKTIVYLLYGEINHTDELPISDGAVKWLEHNNIIVKTTTQHFVSDPLDMTFPYMLQPWVVDYLKKNENLLEEMKEALIKIQSQMKREDELPDLGHYMQ